jgi:hypothetical protein
MKLALTAARTRSIRSIARDMKVRITEGHHIDELAYFAIATMLSAIDAQRHVDVRIFALQPLHDRHRRIGRIGNAKDKLKPRVEVLISLPAAYFPANPRLT